MPLRRYCCTAAFLLLLIVLVTGANNASSRAKVFTEVWETVRDQFYDPKLKGVDWAAARDRYAPLAKKAKTAEEFATVLNEMLGELHTSHTHYYVQDEPEYFQVAGIFWTVLEKKLKPFLPQCRPAYVGIGVFTVARNGKTFVADILCGSPAQAAGLKVGDEIIAAKGKPFQPINLFKNATNQRVTLEIRRSSEGTSEETASCAKGF
jgi:carboxyl-terminal processing protease